ncbi:MAG: tetratricopeptide repeat protein [bacterium]|nr:tetratricopeptide repeat protein [bacterium]
MSRPVWLAAFALAASAALAAPPEVELLPLAPPDVEQLEDAVAAQLQQAHELLESVRAEPGSSPGQLAAAFGETGRLYHAYELSEPAAVCYENASRLAPDDFRWVYYLAILHQQAGRLEAAAARYGRALDIEPRSLPALIHLGEVQLAAQRLDDARATLGRALELDPASAAAMAVLGQVALSEKQYGEAVKHLETALAAVPAANRLHHPLGLAYRGLGDMDKAREHLMQRGKVGVKPVDPLIDELDDLETGERVLLLRGQTAFRAGRYAEAAEAFEAAVAARPESVRARVNLASALAQSGRQDEAVVRFREVLELEPGNRTAHYNLGVLLAYSGDAHGAAESLSAAVDLEPSDAGARLELARALQRLGRWDEARDHAAKVVEQEPASESARLLEVEMLLRQDRFAEARGRLEEAHELMPEAGRVAAALAKVLAACPDPAQRAGARALNLALRVHEASRDPRHAETVALALAELGRCDDAMDWQRRALEAARQAGAEALAGRLEQTLSQLEQRPCRPPGLNKTP